MRGFRIGIRIIWNYYSFDLESYEEITLHEHTICAHLGYLSVISKKTVCMRAIENLAVVHLGDPHYNKRFETMMQIFLSNYFHVDYLTFYKATLPQWLRASPLVSYLYMDAAFVRTAPNNLFFWLIYPIQILFDTIYVFLHIIVLCKSNLRAIAVFSSPFRPGCVIGARAAAKYLRIPFWVDVCRESHGLDYTGFRRRLVQRLEKKLLQSKYKNETILLDSSDLVGHFGLTRNYVLTLNTPASFHTGLPMPVHHTLLSSLRFAQPEQTSLGIRTLFHYSQLVRSTDSTSDHSRLEANSHRPALILCPCNFRGADDFTGVYQLAAALERMFASQPLSTTKNGRVKFTSAIIVVTGRADPYVCSQTRKHHKQLRDVINAFTYEYTLEEGTRMLSHLDECNRTVTEDTEDTADNNLGEDNANDDEDKDDNKEGSNANSKADNIINREGGKHSIKGRSIEARAARKANLAKNKMLLRAAMNAHAASASGATGAKHVRIAKCYLYNRDYHILMDCVDMVYVSKHSNQLYGIPAALTDALIYEKIVLRNFPIERVDELSELVADATVEVTSQTALYSNLTLALNQEEARANEAREYRTEGKAKIMKAKEHILSRSYLTIFKETLLPQLMSDNMTIDEFMKAVQEHRKELEKEEAEQKGGDAHGSCGCCRCGS